MIFSFQNMHKLIFLCLALLGLMSCEEKLPEAGDFNGKYISAIKKDIIGFEDGTSYNMSLSDSAYVYYLVRHAEKDTLPSENPRLSEAGYQRAAHLYELLKGTRVDAIYSTLYMRTIETVDSIANAKGLPIMPYTPQGFRELHSHIKDSTDFHRLLISGHSNTTPVLANFLSDTNLFNASFDEDDYDNFIIIIERSGTEKDVIAARYR